MPRRAGREWRRSRRAPPRSGRASPWRAQSRAKAGAYRRRQPRRHGSRERPRPPSALAGYSARSWREVRLSREPSIRDAQALEYRVTHVAQVRWAVGEVEDPLAQPRLEAFGRPRDPVVGEKRLEVAPPVALHR